MEKPAKLPQSLDQTFDMRFSSSNEWGLHQHRFTQSLHSIHFGYTEPRLKPGTMSCRSPVTGIHSAISKCFEVREQPSVVLTQRQGGLDHIEADNIGDPLPRIDQFRVPHRWLKSPPRNVIHAMSPDSHLVTPELDDIRLADTSGSTQAARQDEKGRSEATFAQSMEPDLDVR